MPVDSYANKEIYIDSIMVDWNYNHLCRLTVSYLQKNASLGFCKVFNATYVTYNNVSQLFFL